MTKFSLFDFLHSLYGVEIDDKGCWVAAGEGRPHMSKSCMINGKSIEKSAGNAARFICKMVHGDPDGNQHAAHTCHNKRCLNPDHVYWELPENNTSSNGAHNENWGIAKGKPGKFRVSVNIGHTKIYATCNTIEEARKRRDEIIADRRPKASQES